MDFERVDSFPEYNLFFSPNWYSHQIADISPSGLCGLGCNDEVQLIDITSRRPITSLYIKTPNHDKIINDINERKVTAVLVTERFIVFSTVSGYLTIFEISNNNIICKFCDCVLNNVQISCIKELKAEDCELELLLTDNKNKIIFAKYKNGLLDQLNLERQGNNHATKCLDIIDYKEDEQFYAKIMDNGSFNIWTPYFEEAVFNVEIGHILNTASFGVFDGLLIISIVSRKNRLIICQVGLAKILEEYVKEQKFVHPNGSNFRILVNLELEVLTPFLPAKSLDRIKLRFHNRVISLNDQRIIITSKDGNMYLTDIESLMKIKEDKLVIKPAAYEDNENPYYEMLDENPHFKNIYFSKLIGDTFVAIGMDRLVSFWRIDKYKVQYDFNIKCLGSKATKVAYSPLDPSSFLIVCNDNTMRLWNIGKKANRFVTTILWKGLDKKSVKNIAFHPKEESLVALICEKELALMDIHAHTIISEFVINEMNEGEITFAGWFSRNVVEKLVDNKLEAECKRLIKSNKGYKQFLSDYKGNTKITSKFVVVNDKYQKEINKDYLLVIYMQDKGFLVPDFKLEMICCVNYQLERFLSAIEFIDWLDKDLLVLAFGDKKGNMLVVKYYKKKYNSCFVNDLHSGLITSIKSNPIKKTKEEMVIATGSIDRTIKIIRIDSLYTNTMESSQLKILKIFKHKFKIAEIDWDPFDEDRLLNTCQKHVTVQVWNIREKEKKADLAIEKDQTAQLKHVGTWDEEPPAPAPAPKVPQKPVEVPAEKKKSDPPKPEPKKAPLKSAWDEEDLLPPPAPKPQTAKKDLSTAEKAPEKSKETGEKPKDTTEKPKETAEKPKETAEKPKDNPEKKAEKPKDEAFESSYVANIRGHKGYITASIWLRYEKDLVLTCSDDQSVKIWNINSIKHTKPPIKKKKEEKLGEVIIENEEEYLDKDDDDVPEKFENYTSKKKKVFTTTMDDEEEDYYNIE